MKNTVNFLEFNYEIGKYTHKNYFLKIKENEIWVSHSSYNRIGGDLEENYIEKIKDLTKYGKFAVCAYELLDVKLIKSMGLNDFILLFEGNETNGIHLENILDLISNDIVYFEGDLSYHYLGALSESYLRIGFGEFDRAILFDKLVKKFGHENVVESLFTFGVKFLEKETSVFMKILDENFEKYVEKIIKINPEIISQFLDKKMMKYLEENIQKFDANIFGFESLKFILKNVNVNLEFQKKSVEKDIRLIDFCSERFTGKLSDTFNRKISNLNNFY